MTAKEMFEKLGYDEYREYELLHNDFIKRGNNYEKHIAFDVQEQAVYAWKKTTLTNPVWHEKQVLTDYGKIDIDELKAVMAQARELGWLDE